MRASVASVFGVAPAELSMLPTDPAVDGFENNAGALSFSTSTMESLRTIAAAIARDALATGKRAATLGCDVAADRDGCTKAFIDRAARRMYRRTITAQERADLQTLAAAAAKETDPTAGAALVIQGLFLSPSFLYRTDVGGGTGTSRTLNSFEIATRLSFLLWASPPDDALLDAAAAGKLDGSDAAAIAAKAREMLNDPRARVAMGAFFEQWLRLRELAKVEHSTTAYPAWGAPLRASMLEETRRLMADFAFAPKGFLDVLTAPYTYVDSTLAKLYGFPEPKTPWERVALDNNATRRGLLTHGSVLAVTARSEDLAPILRGQYVRDVFLCDPAGQPPPGIPQLPAAQGAKSLRERLAAHKTNPSCAGCHDNLDPVGFGFEQYDAIGVRREKDAQGNALTGAGTITGLSPSAFTGPVDLAARLRDAPAVSACLVKQVFRYAAGRTETATDARTIDELTAAFRSSGGSFPDLLAAAASHKSFRMIAAPTGGVCQ